MSAGARRAAIAILGLHFVLLVPPAALDRINGKLFDDYFR